MYTSAIYSHLCTHAHTHTNTHIHTRTHTHIHTYTHVHTHTQTHTQRVGQNHIYTVYTRCFWQGNHQINCHVRCIYTVLANPAHTHITYKHVPMQLTQSCTCNLHNHAQLTHSQVIEALRAGTTVPGYEVQNITGE